MTFPLFLLPVFFQPAPGQVPLKQPAPEAQLAAEDAYRLQRAGDQRGALLAVERALGMAPDHPGWRRLKLDLLVETGALAEANTLNLALIRENPGDGELVLQRVYLLQRMGQPDTALKTANQLLERAGVSAQLKLSTRLALADLHQAMGRPDLALSTLAPVAQNPAPEVQSRRGFLLLRDGRSLEAANAFALALRGDPDPAHRQVLLQGHLEAARKAGLTAEVIKDLQELQRLDPDNQALGLELAYAQLTAKNDQAAFAAFRSALRGGAPAGAWLDGAYTAKRLGRNQEAVAWFTQGLDARRQTPGYQGDAESEFGLRREVEALDRNWGVSLGSYFRQGGVLPGVLSSQKSLQQGVDLFWQPQALSRNGRNVQLFVEGFENLWNADSSATGGPTVQWAAGVRAKPFQEQNLVLGAEKLFRGGEQAQSDWMVKAGYSLDHGVDLKPRDRRWAFGSFFTEGDSLPRTGRYLQSLEARAGESFRFDFAPATVWTPHLVLAGDYDSRNSSRTATGVGAGIQLRVWFRETTIKAPASWFEVSIQVREKLTSSNREAGLFLRANLWF